MKNALFIIIGIVVTGIVLLLCFCFCILANMADEFWDEIKLYMEKKNDRK